MRSFRFLLSRRWVFFALIVVLLCYAAWWLGQWQFHRLDDRKDSNAVVRANENRAPAPVEDVLAPSAEVDEDDEWRLVTATGTYDVDDTVIVRYRTRDGQAGVNAVVPLVTGGGTTLLVDRGWLATENQGTSPTDLPEPPEGEVTVEGWVRADATGDSTAVDGHSTRAISSSAIGSAIDQEVYGGFVQLKSENGEPAAGLEPVELPELNNGPHFFYGLQWWFFGLLAIFGFGYLAYDEWRTARRTEDADESDAPAPVTGSERKQKRAAKAAHKRRVKAAYQAAYEAEKRRRSQQEAQSERSIPPSTGTIEPDTKDAAGDSRNAATRPNSAGSP